MGMNWADRSADLLYWKVCNNKSNIAGCYPWPECLFERDINWRHRKYISGGTTDHSMTMPPILKGVLDTVCKKYLLTLVSLVPTEMAQKAVVAVHFAITYPFVQTIVSRRSQLPVKWKKGFLFLAENIRISGTWHIFNRFPIPMHRLNCCKKYMKKHCHIPGWRDW